MPELDVWVTVAVERAGGGLASIPELFAAPGRPGAGGGGDQRRRVVSGRNANSVLTRPPNRLAHHPLDHAALTSPQSSG